MAPLNKPMAQGSIAEVSQRLLLWANRQGSGLARVEYSSEFSRQRVLEALKSSLAETGVELTSIELPTHRTATEVVQFLLERLANVPGGVVSVSGFAGAFQSHHRLEDSLRVVNFNREALTAFPLRQIWWMTPVLLQTSLHAMPDLHGWFSPQLTLSQSISGSHGDSPESRTLTSSSQPSRNSNIDDARQRSHRLLAQLAAAQSAGAANIDLLTTYLLPALENLAEVGAQKEVRELTSQFEELLGSLQDFDTAIEREGQPLGIATHLDTLAQLYYSQGRYDKAEPLFRKTLEISKTELGDRHPSTATSLNNLALLYKSQGRYGEAEPLYVEALEISKTELGDHHPSTATSLDNLAGLYKSQGRYGEAEPLYVEALKICQTELGDHHPSTATSLNNLAGLYKSQGRYEEAEPLYVEALKIYQTELGDRHPNTATSLNNLAGLYKSQGRYGEAEPLYVEALEIRKTELGDHHPDTATSLNNLASLYYSINRLPEAAAAVSGALDTLTEILGPTHPNTLTAQQNLALIQQAIDSRSS
ncbi:MAG: tetratricopeptide repeat protein [Phormidesmis sp.]